MGLKDLFTGRSKNEQSDCCNVEIIPADEDDKQQNTNTATPQPTEEHCCQDAKTEGGGYPQSFDPVIGTGRRPPPLAGPSPCARSDPPTMPSCSSPIPRRPRIRRSQ